MFYPSLYRAAQNWKIYLNQTNTSLILAAIIPSPTYIDYCLTPNGIVTHRDKPWFSKCDRFGCKWWKDNTSISNRCTSRPISRWGIMCDGWTAWTIKTRCGSNKHGVRNSDCKFSPRMRSEGKIKSKIIYKRDFFKLFF